MQFKRNRSTYLPTPFNPENDGLVFISRILSTYLDSSGGSFTRPIRRLSYFCCLLGFTEPPEHIRFLGICLDGKRIAIYQLPITEGQLKTIRKIDPLTRDIVVHIDLKFPGPSLIVFPSDDHPFLGRDCSCSYHRECEGTVFFTLKGTDDPCNRSRRTSTFSFNTFRYQGI